MIDGAHVTAVAGRTVRISQASGKESLDV